MTVSPNKELAAFFALDCAYQRNPDFSFFHLVFQKKVDLFSEQTEGFEALLRYFEKGALHIPAPTCIAWLDARGLMLAYQDWLLKTVLSHLATTSVPIAMNLCASTLSLMYAHRIMTLCRQWDVSPHTLQIEITETHEPASYLELAKAVYYLRHHGVKVALDDFGTGHASMKYLIYTDLDIIKIDQSFVRDIHQDASKKRALQSMVTIVENHASAIVLEGIEDPRDLETLRDVFQTDHESHMTFQGQGYLFGKPSLLTHPDAEQDNRYPRVYGAR